MDTDRARGTVFFAQYLFLLLFGLVWVNFGYVRARVGDNITLFYLLDGLAICYLLLRAFLVLAKRVSAKWQYLWLALGLAIITAAVGLTGGIRSEAESKVARRPGLTDIAGFSRPSTHECGALYLVACFGSGPPG